VGFFQHPEDVVAFLFFQGDDAAVAGWCGADGEVAQVVGKEAFYASAVAIGAAMLITFVEKRELNRRYKQVKQLAQASDALYEAGAGEEYLARLVKAAEESATQTKQLKQILTDLSNSQIEAGKRHTQQMANEISTALKLICELRPMGKRGPLLCRNPARTIVATYNAAHE